MTATVDLLDQIDRALAIYDRHRADCQYNDLSDLPFALRTEIRTIIAATLDRVAPPNTPYRAATAFEGQIGVLRALRRDYAEGYLRTVQGLVRGEVFSDFLEMAEYLLEQGYKDPAAVLIGGVLEEHLRSLCVARSISIAVGERAKKAETMNSELAGAVASAYGLLDQKSVTSWLDLRNKAAHGKYAEYSVEQVRIMVAAVRDFVARTAAF